MAARRIGKGIALVGVALLSVSTPLLTASAQTSMEMLQHTQSSMARSDLGGGFVHSGSKHPLSRSGKAHYARYDTGLQCVPFARATSGIALKGNAVNWWDAAAGVYARGSRPEVGSVLNFRANSHMRLGHVAVVTTVLGSREVEIDHANWSWVGASKGNVSRGIKVIDVSSDNDWSMVRVELGHTEAFGSTYRTYGFIYDRPDSGRMLANTDDGPQVALSRAVLSVDEVAEVPARIEAPVSLPVDAPDHSFR